MADQQTAEPAEDNRSPETEEAAELDLDEIAERVVEKLKPLLAGPASGPDGDTEEEPGGGEASQTPSLGSAEQPPPPASSDGGSLDDKIAAGVQKALGEKDHAAQHAAMTPVERPPRKGLGRLVWGP